MVGAKGLARGVVERKVRASGERTTSSPLDDVAAARGHEAIAMTLPVRPPIEPMLAKLARELPPAGDVLFEPKWDGFRCIVFRDGDDLDLQSRNSKPLLRYFPELRDPLLAQLPDRCVLDGELVVAGREGPRLRRAAAAPASRRLARQQARGGDPRVVRRVRPARVGRRRRCSTRRSANGARGSRRCSRERAATDLRHARDTVDARPRRDWFARFEGAGFDGVVAKPLDGTYRPGKRTMLKVKHERTADCVVAGFRVHKDGNGVGRCCSASTTTRACCTTSVSRAASPAPLRASSSTFVQPYRRDALDGHPWRDWADFMADAAASRAAHARRHDRWNATKDLSWEPLRIELVAEVSTRG